MSEQNTELPSFNRQLVNEAVLEAFPDVYLPVDPPSTVYHYTNTAGLHGIITDGALWSTNLLFMNDQTEALYAREVFRSEITQLSQSTNDGLKKIFLNFLESLLLDHRTADTFATCFCVDADLLSQWRGYSEAGGGYSIGLSSQKIIENLQDFEFAKMLYNRDKQCEISRFIISRSLGYLDAKDFSHFQQILGPKVDHMAVALNLANFTLGYLESFGEIFKNPHFVEENEWRLLRTQNRVINLGSGGVSSTSPLVSYTEGEPDTHFRLSRSRLVPYAKYKLRQGALRIEPGLQDDNNPLCEIVVGPGQDFLRAHHAIEALLHFNGLSRVKINKSGIPLAPSI